MVPPVRSCLAEHLPGRLPTKLRRDLSVSQCRTGDAQRTVERLECRVDCGVVVRERDEVRIPEQNAAIQALLPHEALECTRIRPVNGFEDDHTPGCEADHPSRNLVFRGERVETLGQASALPP